jgi:multicomponent Na+:H+ antiporter subunit D
MSHLAALPVVVPFLAAPLLVATGSFASRRFEDGLAALSALTVLTLCALLAVHARHEPFAYWVGGWRPRHGVAIDIALSIVALGAGMAAFASLLVLAALAYS